MDLVFIDVLIVKLNTGYNGFTLLEGGWEELLRDFFLLEMREDGGDEWLDHLWFQWELFLNLVGGEVWIYPYFTLIVPKTNIFIGYVEKRKQRNQFTHAQKYSLENMEGILKGYVW